MACTGMLGWGAWGMLGFGVSLLFWGLLAWGAYRVVRSLSRSDRVAEQILARRLAEGGITEDEYRSALAVVREGGQR